MHDCGGGLRLSQRTRETPQTSQWTGDFGRAYTDRNTLTTKELDSLYWRNHGVTRRELNERFLQPIPRDARILEVGCNCGNQLLMLQEMGFTNLWGVEVQSYALESGRARVPGVQLAQASALDLPYEDGYFDLVFTSGVLIHISPANLPRALDEIHRCARIWIWGLEYYAPEVTEVNYRGHDDLLWKMDYGKRYLDRFGELDLVQEQRLPYLNSTNVDTMYLLKRKAS
ncbi:MAG: pseudaminic acid biosynthesis-associated methylase [Candidatus Sulfotelmatobacter sp.]